MMAKTEKGEMVRNYFIQKEKEAIEAYKKPELSRKELALMVIKVEEEKELLQLELAETTKHIAILTHVNKLYTATEIAKELGLQSAAELNIELHNRGIQYKVNNTWLLYSNYSGLGYDSIKQQVLDNGRVIYDRKFTQLGRDFILKLLNPKM